MTDNGQPATATLPAVDRGRQFRWRAFAVHLGISLTILGILLYILLRHWFPGHLFDTDGGWMALRVIAGVDIVLGPLLTLIAAAPNKPRAELRRDFAVIAAIQFTALTWGTWLAWDNRPYALIWLDGEMYSMPWSAFRDEPEARERIAALSGETPRPVLVRLPQDFEARGQIFQDAMRRHSTVLFQAGLYEPFDVADPQVQAAAANYARKVLASPEWREKLVTAGVLETELATQRLLLVPVNTRQTEYHLGYRPASGRVTRYAFQPMTYTSRTRQENAARAAAEEGRAP